MVNVRVENLEVVKSILRLEICLVNDDHSVIAGRGIIDGVPARSKAEINIAIDDGHLPTEALVIELLPLKRGLRIEGPRATAPIT